MATTCCSNCGCNNGSCGCGCTYIVNLPSEAPEILAFQNINVGGVGVLDSAVQPNINFRGVSSANAMMTATLDNVNHNVLLTISAAAIAAAFPAATTAQVGILETATDAEAIAEVATDKILVPSNLAALAASETFAGLVERATQAEVTTGTDAVRFVSPVTLSTLLATKKNTTTFADAVARAALAPAFEGQFGYQLDSNNGYVATGAGAGAWGNLFTFGQFNTVVSGTTIELAGGTLLWSNANQTYGSGSKVNVTLDETWTTCNLLLSGSALDLDGVDLKIVGSSVAASSLLGTTGTPGDPTSYLISTFISTNNTQTGWGTPSGTLARTTFAAYNGQVISAGYVQAEVVAMDAALVLVSQRLAALITDLKARLLPAT